MELRLLRLWRGFWGAEVEAEAGMRLLSRRLSVFWEAEVETALAEI